MADELDVEPFGPLDALYAAVRRRAPQVSAICARPTGTFYRSTPERRAVTEDALRLRVSYREETERMITWDEHGGVYRWTTGPDSGAAIPADTEQAAARIAEALGASADPQGE
ncbi:hypothetical protein AGRA3207_001473 [Actinomadura graeca]|uniref:DUF3024 domain-containing protein n=1 Tax=Actinomadura graeca TaxID=2750812 RepID=A0ABX8QPI5_9ACTN|nr:hypothetical protein [Actinomadura graeca]QXJ20710.1 hypothetical protein AGRA3207_001473 [Actinomadura graeca]